MAKIVTYTPWAVRRHTVTVYLDEVPDEEIGIAETVASIAEHDAFVALLSKLGLTLADLSRPSSAAKRDDVARCAGCGRMVCIELLDSKPGPNTLDDWETLLCPACYGPGWCVNSWDLIEQGREIADALDVQHAMRSEYGAFLPSVIFSTENVE